MRILHKDVSKGVVKVKVESIDDLWHLSHVIEEGDVVYDVTYRRQQAQQDVIRSSKTEKVRMYLGVRVEKIEFSHYSDSLRLTGVIVEGDQTGNYHTLSIEPQSTPKIVKSWRPFQLDRLNEAVRSSKEPRILIVAIDEGEADFGIVKQYGIDFAVSISRSIPGKRDTSNRKSEKESFFKEVADKLSSYLDELNIPSAIVAGPGFVKDEFQEWAKEHAPSLASNLHIKSISVTGGPGILEVVKRGYVEEIYEQSRAASEITLMESFFQKILTDDAVYGLEEVRTAVMNSQAEYVVVTDEMLRNSEEAQEIIEHAKNVRSTPHIISTDHEGGEKLRSLGGIGAALRFKLTY
ncbi:mRNA surveillance protein pelota [archaeon]|nr:MAG: mRNA surveillance protein pelota [archaeon]